jgi:hypothetical protein
MSLSRRSASYTSLVGRAGSYQQQQPQQYYSRANNASRGNYQSALASAAQAAESNVERSLIQARNPIQASGEEIVLNNQRVTLLNRDETANFQGPIPLDQYELNADPNPVVIRKKPADKIRYRQNVTIRYLKPPTPKPSELVIVEEAPRPQQAPPPLVVRQQSYRAVTPAPIVYREAPPPPPPPAERRVIYLRAPQPPPPPPPQPCCPQATVYQPPCGCNQSAPSYQQFQPYAQSASIGAFGSGYGLSSFGQSSNFGQSQDYFAQSNFFQSPAAYF